MRNFRGGTLLMIVASVLITVLLGLAFILLSRTMMSSRQAVGAVDASALSMAKELVCSPTVNAIEIGTPEFAGLGEGGSDELSLLSYNKAVGQTLMLAIDAEEDKSPEALKAARHLKSQLDKLAAALFQKFKSSSEPAGIFSAMSSANPLKLTNESIEQSGDVDWSFTGEGEASDIFFDPQSLSKASLAKLSSYFKTDGAKSPTGHCYLRGYEPITVAGITVEAIPVFPGQQPHLISMRSFNDGKRTAHALPNCLRVCSKAGSTGLLQSAAAVIGRMQPVLKTAAPSNGKIAVTRSFPGVAADISNGCIIFTNAAPAQIDTSGEIVSDGDNDLFNKELFSPSRILQSTNGVFTTDAPQMDAWIAYNNGQGPDPRLTFDITKMRRGGNRGQLASIEDLRQVKSLLCECTHTMYSTELTGPCIDKDILKTWAGNYRRWSVVGPGPKAMLSAYEAAKYEVLNSRAKFSEGTGHHCYRGTSFHSGMKLIEEDREYVCPPSPVQFSQDGTAHELMDQVSKRKCKKWLHNAGCYYGTLLEGDAIESIYRDIRKIKPFSTDEEIKTVLNSKKLKLGQKLWLRKEGDALILSEQGPPSPSFIGMMRACYSAATINLAGTVINTAGDAGFADAPYSWSTEVSVVDGGERGPDGLFKMKTKTVDARDFNQGYFQGLNGLETVRYEPFHTTETQPCLGEACFYCDVATNSLTCPN